MWLPEDCGLVGALMISPRSAISALRNLPAVISFFGIADQQTFEQDVFETGQFVMKSGAAFDEGCEAAFYFDGAAIGLQTPAASLGSVLFLDPLGPGRPRVRPRGTSREMSLRASKS
jgi:hypothetical protein